MKKLADGLFAFVVLVFTLAILAVFGFIAYFTTIKGFWPITGFALFMVLATLAATLKGISDGLERRRRP